MSANDPTRKSRLWPGIIFVLIGANVVGTATMVFVAAADKTSAVEPQFYDKAVKWNEQSALLRRAGELNWAFEPSVGAQRDAKGRRELTLQLRTAEGVALAGARVELEAFHQADSGHRVQSTLEDRGEGRYTARVAADRPGYWELRFKVTRGPESLVKIMSVSVARPAEATAK